MAGGACRNESFEQWDRARAQSPVHPSRSGQQCGTRIAKQAQLVSRTLRHAEANRQHPRKITTTMIPIFLIPFVADATPPPAPEPFAAWPAPYIAEESHTEK